MVISDENHIDDIRYFSDDDVALIFFDTSNDTDECSPKGASDPRRLQMMRQRSLQDTFREKLIERRVETSSAERCVQLFYDAGIDMEDVLAEYDESEFTSAFLDKIGIDELNFGIGYIGLQKKLILFHKEIRKRHKASRVRDSKQMELTDQVKARVCEIQKERATKLRLSGPATTKAETADNRIPSLCNEEIVLAGIPSQQVTSPAQICVVGSVPTAVASPASPVSPATSDGQFIDAGKLERWSNFNFDRQCDMQAPVSGTAIEHEINTKISLWRGDITKLRIGAIVNAANKRLLGGGGIDKAIHVAAGPELLEECRQLAGCATGSAKLTRGHRLPCEYVIHAVGPRFGEPNCARELSSCYSTSLALARSTGIRTVSFCCISTGIFGYPNDEAALIALRTVRSWCVTWGLCHMLRN